MFFRPTTRRRTSAWCPVSDAHRVSPTMWTLTVSTASTGVKLTNPALSVWVSMGGGTIDYPFNPGELVMGAQGTFYARALDCLPQLTTDIMTRAAMHDGTSVVEVLQNCMIFNDKAHAAITDRAVRDDRTIILEDGKPMIFGKEKNKGLRFNGRCLEAVTIGENGITMDDIMIHQRTPRTPAST